LQWLHMKINTIERDVADWYSLLPSLPGLLSEEEKRAFVRVSA